MKLIKNMEAFFVASVLCGLTLAWISDQAAWEQQLNSATPLQTAKAQHVAPDQGAAA